MSKNKKTEQKKELGRKGSIPIYVGAIVLLLIISILIRLMGWNLVSNYEYIGNGQIISVEKTQQRSYNLVVKLEDGNMVNARCFATICREGLYAKVEHTTKPNGESYYFVETVWTG